MCSAMVTYYPSQPNGTVCSTYDTVSTLVRMHQPNQGFLSDLVLVVLAKETQRSVSLTQKDYFLHGKGKSYKGHGHSD